MKSTGGASGTRRGQHPLLGISGGALVVVTMEQRWPYLPETEESLKPVIYGAIEE